MNSSVRETTFPPTVRRGDGGASRLLPGGGVVLMTPDVAAEMVEAVVHVIASIRCVTAPCCATLLKPPLSYDDRDLESFDLVDDGEDEAATVEPASQKEWMVLRAVVPTAASAAAHERTCMRDMVRCLFGVHAMTHSASITPLRADGSHFTKPSQTSEDGVRGPPGEKRRSPATSLLSRWIRASMGPPLLASRDDVREYVAWCRKRTAAAAPPAEESNRKQLLVAKRPCSIVALRIDVLVRPRSLIGEAPVPEPSAASYGTYVGACVPEDASDGGSHNAEQQPSQARRNVVDDAARGTTAMLNSVLSFFLATHSASSAADPTDEAGLGECIETWTLHFAVVAPARQGAEASAHSGAERTGGGVAGGEECPAVNDAELLTSLSQWIAYEGNAPLLHPVGANRAVAAELLQPGGRVGLRVSLSR